MRRSVPILAALSAGLLAACGGSGSTMASGTSAAGSSSPAAPTVTTVTETATATATATASDGSGSSTAAAGGTATALGPAACRAGVLALSFLGQQGATGHGELGFALRNTGSASCSTIGYPGVQFLSSAGADLPTTPTHTTRDFFGTTTRRPQVLKPGASVSFRLGVTHGAGPGAGCTTAHALQVIPPNDTSTLRVSIPDGAAECGQTTVSPLVPGETAYP